MKVFGIVSDHRALKSRSPAMHNLVFQRLKIEAVYVPLAVEPGSLGQAVAGIKALGLAGANVTVPYKEAVIPHLDGLDPQAAAVGAVNTLFRQGRRLIGANTDAAGFSAALAGAGYLAAGAPALVIGTGGAARAVLHSLNELGATPVTVAGRHRDRTGELARRFGVSAAGLTDLTEGRFEAGLVVNATSASAPDEAPQLARLAGEMKIGGCRLVFDLNYGRSRNFWQDLAARNEAAFLDGLTLLAHQAGLSLKHWTGLDVPAVEYLRALGVEP